MHILISQIPRPPRRFGRRVVQGLCLVLVGLMAPQSSSSADTIRSDQDLCFPDMVRVCLLQKKKSQRGFHRAARKLKTGTRQVHIIRCGGLKKPNDVFPAYAKIHSGGQYVLEWGMSHIAGTNTVYVFLGNQGKWALFPEKNFEKDTELQKYPHIIWNIVYASEFYSQCFKALDEFRKKIGLAWGRY